ncbi:hypothetical protein [Clostridium thermarum]|uniref:hypothetical protein n=1 Tax=Clostridium thermarum TaxID=1716543 RepID=UPI00111CB4EF|nr:hypothetical protein [Clostridium thermarum]
MSKCKKKCCKTICSCKCFDCCKCCDCCDCFDRCDFCKFDHIKFDDKKCCHKVALFLVIALLFLLLCKGDKDHFGC